MNTIDETKQMSVDIEDSPSVSQEAMLLEEKPVPVTEATTNDKAVKKGAKLIAPAKLAHGKGKPITETIISRNESTVALKPGASSTSTGGSTETQGRSRSRNKSRRNQVTRSEPEVAQTMPGKRGRVSGETPPNVTQPPKKNRHKKNKDSPLANRLTGIANNPSVASGSGAQPPATPVALVPQSSGAGGSATADQPNVEQVESSMQSVPPEGVNSQSIGSNATGDKSVEPPRSSEDDSNAELDGQLTETYASVASNLCVAVIDQRSPDSMVLLDQKRYDTLYSLLTDLMLSQVGKNIKSPEIDDTRLQSGAMRVRCANLQTRKWFERFVPLLDKKKLWSEASLVVIDYSDIPKPHKFNVFVRGIKKSARDIFNLIEKQNKGISTKGWSALACKATSTGTQMTIGVCHDSFELLRTRSNSLYCGLNKAVFSLVKSCKENRVAIQQSVENSSDQVLVAMETD